jgi:hypothetical protein
MVTRALFVLALLALAACGGEQRETQEAKAQKDRLAATLTAQLKSLNFAAAVAHEGKQLHIRATQANVGQMRRVVCHQTGWPSNSGEMVRLDLTRISLRQSGITKIKITGDGDETRDVELLQDGRCQKDH